MTRSSPRPTDPSPLERLLQRLIGLSVAVLLCGGALLLSSCACPANAYCGEPVSTP